MIDHLTADNSTLTAGLLEQFHFLSLWRRFIFHVDRVVSSTTIAFLAQFVLMAHPLVSVLHISVFVLHELPALNISLHLLHTTAFNFLVLYHLLLLALLCVVGCKVFINTVQRLAKVTRLGIGIVQLGVVDELVVPSDVFAHPKLINILISAFHATILIRQL